MSLCPSSLHKGGETDPQTEHFAGEGVPEPVRGNTLRAPHSFCSPS